MSWKFKPSQEFMNLVNDPNLSNQEIAKILGININTLNSRLNSLGINRRKAKQLHRDAKLTAEIQRLVAEGKKPVEITVALNIGYTKLRELAGPIGYELPPIKKMISHEEAKRQKAEVQRLARERNDLSNRAIAELVGCTFSTAEKWIIEIDVNRRAVREKHRREQLKPQVRAMVEAGCSPARITLELAIGHRLFKILMDEMGLPTTYYKSQHGSQVRTIESKLQVDAAVVKKSPPKKSPRPVIESKPRTYGGASIADKFDRRTGALIAERQPDFSSYTVKYL